jgi:NADPH:quinone reductase-like Zn-dependent oxidoreductase
MRAVQWDSYGGVDVLGVRDVADPVPGAGQVRVRVRAAGLNPGEAKIRAGEFRAMFPATFPSGEGTDFAGTVDAVGDGVDAFAVGDEVLGWTDERASHAELVVVPDTQLTGKPADLPWEVAGSLFVAGTTALAAVDAVAPGPGDLVAVAGAAGAVGSLAVQLVLLRGAKAIGIAGAANQQWVGELGAVPVDYSAGELAELLAAAADGQPIDGFIDTVGGPYVDLALELGVSPDRVDTIANLRAASEKGVKRDGNAQGASAENLALVAAMVADGRLELSVARTYPLDDVRAAYEELETGHVRGKLVLIP